MQQAVGLLGVYGTARPQSKGRGNERSRAQEQAAGRPAGLTGPLLIPEAPKKATALVMQGLRWYLVQGASCVEKDAAVYMMYSEIRWFITVNNEFLRINRSCSTNLTPSKSKVFPSTPSSHIYLSPALPCALLISMLGRALGSRGWREPRVLPQAPP